MFESQPSQLQTIWLTGLAAHQERQAQSRYPSSPQEPDGAARPCVLRFLHALASFAKAATRWRMHERAAASAHPACCVAPHGC
jgi:hypothetical protein